MNWLDIVIIVVLIIGAVTGLRTGIIKVVVSLVGIIAGVLLAGRLYVPLAGSLSFVPHDGAAKILAFAIIFIVVMIIALIVGNVLTKIVSAIMLGWINRLLGGVFGFISAGLFFGAILAIWAKFLGVSGVIADSAIAPVLLKYIPLVLALLPGEFDAVRSFF